MDTGEFIALMLLAAGEVKGKTKLQKQAYFLGLLTNHLDSLGYRAHFYGPYSDDVAAAVAQLKTVGAVDQNVSEWGSDRAGFELKRYDFRLNEPGRKYAESIAARNTNLWVKIQNAVKVYQAAGDLEYVALSIAAKTFFLLGQSNNKSKPSDVARLAFRFGWEVSTAQIDDAMKYLVKLGLVTV